MGTLRPPRKRVPGSVDQVSNYVHGQANAGQKLREAEAHVRVKLEALAKLEAEIDARVTMLRNEPPFRPRGISATCGTHSGYKTHIVNKTPICQPCRTARALYQREYRRRKKQEIAA